MITLYLLIITGAALHLIWHYTLRSHYLEAYKSALFEQRDALFELGADHKIPFDEEVYRALEARINMLLSSADKLSFTRLIMSRYMPEQKDHAEPVLERYRLALEKFDTNTRNRVIEIESRVYQEAVLCLFRQNLLSFCVMKLFSIFRSAVDRKTTLRFWGTDMEHAVIHLSYQA